MRVPHLTCTVTSAPTTNRARRCCFGFGCSREGDATDDEQHERHTHARTRHGEETRVTTVLHESLSFLSVRSVGVCGRRGRWLTWEAATVPATVRASARRLARDRAGSDGQECAARMTDDSHESQWSCVMFCRPSRATIRLHPLLVSLQADPSPLPSHCSHAQRPSRAVLQTDGAQESIRRTGWYEGRRRGCERANAPVTLLNLRSSRSSSPVAQTTPIRVRRRCPCRCSPTAIRRLTS